jgi:hypothetical protein
VSGRLEFQSDGAAEKGRDGEHGAAGGNKGRHKCWGADLFIGEVDGGAQITKLEVFNKFVFSRKSARRAAEFAGIVPVEKFANRTPFLRASDDSVADFDQRLRFRVPQSGRSETAAGLKVKIEAGRVNVLPLHIFLFSLCIEINSIDVIHDQRHHRSMTGSMGNDQTVIFLT